MKRLSFVWLVAAFAAGQDQTGSFSGTVVDSVSHQPVRKATVNLNYMGNSGIRTSNPGPQSTATDSAGTFKFDNLPAGQYAVMVQHQEYSRTNGTRKTVTVKAGEEGSPVTLELIPGAIVTGRVLDEDGDPLSNCFVQPSPAKNLNGGVPTSGRRNSDEDGIYRLAAIPPGKYIFSVQCMQPAFQPRPFSSGPDPPPSQAYAMQYYPGASDPKSAQVVDLAAGSERTGIDFKMKPTAVTEVRGNFSPAGADWHGRNMNLQLLPADPSIQRGFGGRENVDSEKGTFDLQMVFPGSYVLAASSFGGTNEDAVGFMERIEVGDKVVEKVIELRHSMDVNGSVTIEGNTNSTLSLSQIVIQLLPVYQVGMGMNPVQVKDDGTFTIKSVMPGPVRVRVDVPNAFLKSARMGTEDVTEKPIDLSSGAADALKLIVSTNTATVQGSAPAGQLVYAERLEEIQSPFYRNTRGTLSDVTGHYKLDNLAPGKYRFVVSEMGGPIPDEGGQEVTIQEGDSITLDLKPQEP